MCCEVEPLNYYNWFWDNRFICSTRDNINSIWLIIHIIVIFSGGSFFMITKREGKKQRIVSENILEIDGWRQNWIYLKISSDHNNTRWHSDRNSSQASTDEEGEENEHSVVLFFNIDQSMIFVVFFYCSAYLVYVVFDFE